MGLGCSKERKASAAGGNEQGSVFKRLSEPDTTGFETKL